MAPTVLTAGDIEAFDLDGAICLRGVFGEDWLEKVRRGIKTNLANPSQYRYDDNLLSIIIISNDRANLQTIKLYITLKLHIVTFC